MSETPLKLFPRQMTAIKVADWSTIENHEEFMEFTNKYHMLPHRVVVLPRANIKRVRLILERNKPQGCFTTLDKIGMITIIISMIECWILMAINLNVGIVAFLSYIAFIILTAPKNEVCNCQ